MKASAIESLPRMTALGRFHAALAKPTLDGGWVVAASEHHARDHDAVAARCQSFFDASQNLREPRALAGVHDEPDAARAAPDQTLRRHRRRVAELLHRSFHASPDRLAGSTAVEHSRYGADAHGSTLCGLNDGGRLDRKSTRLNSSHVKISYAVFCL